MMSLIADPKLDSWDADTVDSTSAGEDDLDAMDGQAMILPRSRSSLSNKGEELPLQPTSRRKDGSTPVYLYLLTVCSALGGFLFGYDTGVISGALVLLRSPDSFNLSAVQSETVVSAAVFGAIIGAIASSYGNHLLGRRPVILLSSFLFTLGSILMGFAANFTALLFGRLIVGFAIGASSMTVPLYIAEVSPPDIRGTLVSVNTLFLTGGQFFASLLDAFLSEVHDGWRFMLGAAAIPALLQFLGFLVLPESPRYLVSKSHTRAAQDALAQIRGTSDIESEFRHMESEVLEHKRESRGSILEGLKEPSVRRALMLGCSLQALQQACGINTVMYYGATIVQLAGFADASTAIWLSTLVAFSNFIFTFVGIYLVDRLGRRSLTLWSLAGVVIMLTSLGASFYIADHTSDAVTSVGDCSRISSCFSCAASDQCGLCAQPLDSGSDNFVCAPASGSSMDGTFGVCSSNDWHFHDCPTDSKVPGVFILIALFVYLAVFASGMGCMPWTVNAEIYPLHARNFALSAATSVNWITNLVVSFTFLSVVQELSPSGAFWLYAVIALAGFVYLFGAMPETKGLELEEIQALFEPKQKYVAVRQT